MTTIRGPFFSGTYVLRTCCYGIKMRILCEMHFEEEKKRDGRKLSLKADASVKIFQLEISLFFF